jgi:hypothetical protein
LGYPGPTVKEVEQLMQRRLHPIQVRKQERKEHYTSHRGFAPAQDDGTIFHRQIVPGSHVNKERIPAEFHKRSGTLNIAVHQNQLIK